MCYRSTMNLEFLKKIFGDDNDKRLKQAGSFVAQVNGLEAEYQALTPEALAGKTAEFKSRLAAGETLDSLVPEAFAAVREAARRTLNQRHYDVQLLGGFFLHQGSIAEMKTGEGKTLVATLPAYTNALVGRGVHIITVNDYLARRDAAWMGQIYAYLGLTVAVINHNSSYLYDGAAKEADAKRDEEGSFHVVYEFLRPISRQEAYAADITYGTNNEFGFDYLRDHLAYSDSGVVQKPDRATGRFHYALIDEVDSILIDEARTPLIISAPVAQSESLYGTFAKIATQLEEGADFEVDHKLKATTLTEEGIIKAEKILGVDDIYTEKGVKYVHHLETAVRAKALFERDKDYVVKEGEIIIVDPFTGRLQPGRRWSEGLHQAIEAKEGVRVQEESRTFATVTLQNYFRLYDKLSGMTGTAATSAEEFLKVYGLPVVKIPAHRPSIRRDLPDQVFQSEKGKLQALAATVKELHQRGQPVLIGTVSIEKNELLSAYLKQVGVPHRILNAKNHEEEGEIIASAGAPGSVVVATNMAGRGVDIKLGGAIPTAETQAKVRELGGLFVIGTERHEARRIDNQLRGRAGRQGDPGQTQFYLSLEDTLMKVFGSDRIKGMMGRLGIPEDQPIEAKLVSKAIESAQSKIEGVNFDLRKHLLEYDDVVNHQRITIYSRRERILFGVSTEVAEYLNRAIETLGLNEEERNDFQASLKVKQDQLGDSYLPEMRKLILQVMDMYWVEHLEAIDSLRSSVRLRAYGQRDPLVEFKREGLELFKQLEASIFNTILETIPKLETGVKSAEQVSMQEVHEGAKLIAGNNNQAPAQAAEDKIGRNDLCPCGSGKKWKKCGALNTEEHQRLMAGK
jgi:preprotein translocase subunit SecA